MFKFLAGVFFAFTCAAFCCVANGWSTCLWKIDKRVCIFPEAEQDKIVGEKCITGMIFKIEKSLRHCFTADVSSLVVSHHLSIVHVSNNLVENTTINETALFVFVHYKVKGNFDDTISAKIPGKVAIYFTDTEHENKPGCNPSASCTSNEKIKANNAIVFLAFDRKPKVSFELVKKTSGRSSMAGNTILIEVENTTEALWIDRSVSDLVVDVHVLDEDVFKEEDADAFEYSAISKLNVTVSAIVQFSENSHEDEVVASARSVEYQLDAKSGICCEEECVTNSSIIKNHALVHYRLGMADLHSAVQDLLNASQLNGFVFARVVFKIDALAASGKTNPLTTSNTLTLAVLIQQRLKKL